MHVIARYNNKLLIKNFIAYGADINCTDFLHCTPLYIAAKYNSLSVVMELIKFGAKPLIPCYKGFLPSDVATNAKLRVAIKEVEKAHNALRFLFSREKRRDFLSNVKYKALSAKYCFH